MFREENVAGSANTARRSAYAVTRWALILGSNSIEVSCPGSSLCRGLTTGRIEVIIRLLGPLELTGPNGAVHLSSAGQRTLVARLALKPGETVPRSALMDALWSDEVPATATKTLHSLLARLRGQIRDAGLGELITTREPGYALNAPADTVDAARFEALVAASRQSDGPAESAKLLREALALWVGDPLADCRPGEWIRQESARSPSCAWTRPKT
ncbi:hypothetical protein FXN61_02550 [Lentzea sp. PSKA42]|uniref:OmpR/PhoB-type domain-containing protein n=1 Tax=Lentzea indica TaxID=2604800 RepID=A0ABX1FAC8_9PSEU|nr:hypothetical protein [Lentzea indica]